MERGADRNVMLGFFGLEVHRGRAVVGPPQPRRWRPPVKSIASAAWVLPVPPWPTIAIVLSRPISSTAMEFTSPSVCVTAFEAHIISVASRIWEMKLRDQPRSSESRPRPDRGFTYAVTLPSNNPRAESINLAFAVTRTPPPHSPHRSTIRPTRSPMSSSRAPVRVDSLHTSRLTPIAVHNRTMRLPVSAEKRSHAGRTASKPRVRVSI